MTTLFVCRRFIVTFKVHKYSVHYYLTIKAQIEELE